VGVGVSARCKCGAHIGEPARCTNGHDQPTDSLERIADLLAERIDYDRLADVVAERLVQFAPAAKEPMVGVEGAARILTCSTDTVYEHQLDLGVKRIGSGPKAPLRFDPERLRQPSRVELEADDPPQRRRSMGPAASDVPLLPIRGED